MTEQRQRPLKIANVQPRGQLPGFRPILSEHATCLFPGTASFKLTNVFIAGSTCLSLVFWLVIECFARGILSAFITQADIVTKGITNFRLMFAVFPTYGLLIMTLTYLQSLGKPTDSCTYFLSAGYETHSSKAMITSAYLNGKRLNAGNILS